MPVVRDRFGLDETPGDPDPLVKSQEWPARPFAGQIFVSAEVSAYREFPSGRG